MAPPPHAIPQLPTTVLTTLTTHTGPVNALTFSALGGTYILTGSSDRTIHLSRTETLASSSSTSPTPVAVESPIQKYAAHGYPVLDLACAADNTAFASVGGDKTVFLWDVQSAQTTRRFGANTQQGHGGRVNCVRFGGTGDSVVVSGSDDRSVRVWDVKSRDGRPVMVLEEARDGVSCLAVLEGEIVAGSVDGRVRGYDLRMGRAVVDVVGGSVVSLQITGDGGAMLVGSLDGRLKLLDRRDGGLLQGFETEKYKNTELRLKSCLAGLSEGLVLSGSEGDGGVRCWDVLTGKMLGNVEVSDVGKVVSVVSWRDGVKGNGRKEIWAAGGADGVVRVYGKGGSDG